MPEYMIVSLSLIHHNGQPESLLLEIGFLGHLHLQLSTFIKMSSVQFGVSDLDQLRYL